MKKRKTKKAGCLCDEVGIEPSDIPIIVGGVSLFEFRYARDLLLIARTAQIACFRCGKLNSLSKSSFGGFSTWIAIQCSCGAYFLAHHKYFIRKEDIENGKVNRWGKKLFSSKPTKLGFCGIIK